MLFTAIVGVSLSAVPAVGTAVLLPPRKTFALEPSSLIVPVPAAPTAFVTVPVMVPVLSVNDSVPSKVVSLVIAVRTSTDVAPAASVMPPDAATQFVPLRYCSAPLAAVSVPTVALPLASVGVKLMAPAPAKSRLTSKTA
ncbi:hypothetical protein [Roseateles sp. BYS96W]|uniref:Uncharacterized protein n=1 Tax=Pelomonas nitida TaxID=3299027 RepID=A0ABW7G1H6_9BURK